MVDRAENLTKVSMAVIMAAIIALSAQLSFKIGPVPYTMQNFAIMLSGFLLGPYYGAMAVIIYLGMIAVGLPLGAGGGGPGVLMGYTAGYLFGFVFSASLAGIFGRKFGDRPVILWISTFVAALPTYLLGFAVFYRFALGSAGLSDWALSAVERFGIPAISFPFVIFAATVLIYIPQDMLIDHLLAVVVFRYVRDLMIQRGVRL
ncbi:biotin transporter BioY [Geoglobus acetivorans]|uniref:Substrate-specific component BioY of biotin ECF transporter n=1 Tax=Geoglobus acetivorans TaxID=565033 RepID=A0A0A7GBF1_GEOAI|nr:Substrate-specific component BioY of biotin ECF transporter [Geoglobus acetivorans]